MLTPQQRPAYAIAMTKNDPVLKRIAAYPWPRGGIVARRVNRGYSLFSARTFRSLRTAKEKFIAAA